MGFVHGQYSLGECVLGTMPDLESILGLDSAAVVAVVAVGFVEEVEVVVEMLRPSLGLQVVTVLAIGV